MEINKDFASFTRLLAMGDWLKLKRFNSKKLYEELQEFANEWKTYNSLKPDNKRYGLSVTSLDGGLSGVPDLESLLEYNNKNGTSYTNADINNEKAKQLELLQTTDNSSKSISEVNFMQRKATHQSPLIKAFDDQNYHELSFNESSGQNNFMKYFIFIF